MTKLFFSTLQTASPQGRRPLSPTASYPGNGQWQALPVLFDGEKNLGEMGPLKNYYVNYAALRLRSWQLLLESEIWPTILNKMLEWFVGDGLKLECHPNRAVLASEGIDLSEDEIEEFNKTVEARWAMYADSRSADNSNENTLNELEYIVHKNAYVGGDVLVILRYEDEVKIQIVDASHVHSQVYGNDYYSLQLENGNQVRNGVEMDIRGQHVAYWVRNRNNVNDKLFTYERIAAYNSEGFRIAFLVYGESYRIHNYRGLPLCAPVMEAIKQLDRYKTAVVGSAEEHSKVNFQIVHNENSTGENPMNKTLTKAFSFNPNAGNQLPVDAEGRQLANTVAVSTGKETWNMPIGTELKVINAGTGQAMFKEFYEPNFNSICSALGIPPEVAISLFGASFSASRGAFEAWKKTIIIRRKRNSSQFKQRVYEFWLHTQILKGKIQAPGYLTAFYTGNEMALAAYRLASWTGSMPGHIDPLKEANALRVLLGGRAVNMPLIDYEEAVDRASGGDSIAILAQFSRELKDAINKGISDANDGVKPLPIIKDEPTDGDKEE